MLGRELVFEVRSPCFIEDTVRMRHTHSYCTLAAITLKPFNNSQSFSSWAESIAYEGGC